MVYENSVCMYNICLFFVLFFIFTGTPETWGRTEEARGRKEENGGGKKTEGGETMSFFNHYFIGCFTQKIFVSFAFVHTFSYWVEIFDRNINTIDVLMVMYIT